MPLDYWEKKSVQAGGVGMKRHIMTEEQRRIERLRNIKSTVAGSMKVRPSTFVN